MMVGIGNFMIDGGLLRTAEHHTSRSIMTNERCCSATTAGAAAWQWLAKKATAQNQQDENLEVGIVA